MGTKVIAKSVRDKAKFELDKVKPINHVDKAFIPALFGHANDDDFILPSHSEELHEKYAGDKNLIMFEGDHNSVRPQFFNDSVVIFFINSLQVHSIVPQDKKHFEQPDSSVPTFDIHAGFQYDDDEDPMQYEGFSNDVTEEDMIKMAIEQSLASHKQESEEQKENTEKTEEDYLAEAFSLNEPKK